MQRMKLHLVMWVTALGLTSSVVLTEGIASAAIVVPNHLATAEGPSNNCAPFCSSPARYQQLYDASEMGGSGIVDKIAFRLDQIVGGPGFFNQPVDLEVRLSHVTFGPDAPAFSNAYGRNVGPDETLVLDAVVPLSGSTSPTKPNPFDIILDVDNTFTYNGTDNLLMEIRIFSTQPNPDGGFTIFAFDATGSTTGDSVSRLFISGGPGNALAPTGFRTTLGLVTQFTLSVPVAIDIKPSSDVNPINPLGRGVIPVAILGSNDFDVEDVDGTTLAFAGGAMPAHDLADTDGFEDHLEDVNDDGMMDLVSHYRTQETGIEFGQREACLTGQTLGGIDFRGCDVIRTVGSCGLGFELILLLPPLLWLRRRRTTTR